MARGFPASAFAPCPGMVLLFDIVGIYGRDARAAVFVGLLRMSASFLAFHGCFGFGWGVFVGGLSRVKMHHVPFRELGWNGLEAFGLWSGSGWSQPESLILAQNERWRQA